VKHSYHVVFLLFMLMAAGLAEAQTGDAAKLSPDQAGCVDSKFLPKLTECRIDNCEKKDIDHREIAVSEDGNGDVVETPIDGKSRSLMYECREGTEPRSVIERAEAGLKAGGFEIPYKFADAEGSLTAHKDDFWIVVDAAAHYYTLTEITAVPPEFDSAVDADSLAEMLEHFGHVALYGVQFFPGRPDLEPASSGVLQEVVTMMNDHPNWRIRVQGHTDNTGTKAGNMTLSMRRATAVVQWLATNGVRRVRLDAQGIGDAHPVSDNTTEAGRAKNRRIELVKLPDMQAQ